ncbi:conserved Plasmodium protein, unknown function [Babesia microti strain RI]|uniref:Uncharacterized protein n=1 Tax=Babesia microti (strain RI) TaxID=1133968 RepID=A0A1R4AAJ4_BABMR|nr:conserved Plasmodium protein, unknown function [Babesia microti strain RI]SJK86007.1 conserved Plasmodium protein, unknown function [Babesia microti strain RI]|eukprot:XP_021338206.1 conserved Plasmodium protein, unknown function [Babesia microti strain RI]
MSSPGLAFANLTLLLDVPQLPAILAGDIFTKYRIYSNQILLDTFTNANMLSDIHYPYNRINIQSYAINKMGRSRKYTSDLSMCPFGVPY